MSASSTSTIVAALRDRAAGARDETAFVHLREPDDPISLSYRDLHERASQIAAGLVANGLSGERVVLVCPPGLSYVTALFGCLYARAVAIPVYPPSTHSLTVFRSIIADAGAAAVLCSPDVHQKRARLFARAPELAALQWLDVDNISSGGEREYAVDVNVDHLAYLQYTSGSTGTPKGVMITHGNLAHNLAFLAERSAQMPGSVVVSWLPPYHDLGLIVGILGPVYRGCPSMLMSPAAFAQRPIRWLEAITAYRGNVSGGPIFAYEQCVQRITAEQKSRLDLSSWRIAFTGAEPIRPDVLDRFAAAFAECGFRREAFCPGYGLAESTLIVTMNRPDRPPLVVDFDAAALADKWARPPAGGRAVRRLVGCGEPADDHVLRIVNPDTLAPCAEGELGEVWLSGPSIGHGYWNRPDETAGTFLASFVDERGESCAPYLRTGDLGFMHAGQLFVAARLKDTIIVRGRNYHPDDLESVAEQSHRLVRHGHVAAFSVLVGDDENDEQVALAIELERGADDQECRTVADAARGAIAEQHGVAVHAVHLVRAGQLPRTTSGKIRRRACRERFGTDAAASPGVDATPSCAADAASPARRDVEASAHNATAAAVEQWLCAAVASRVGHVPDEIDPRRSLASYGLDSMAIIALTEALGTFLGRAVAPTIAYEHPSIDEMARAVAAEEPRHVEPTIARSGREPIAITGIACRFPGAEGPREFWALLAGGRDAVSEVPRERWKADRLFSLDHDRPGTIASRWGGFLTGVERFDAAFFDISPREAACIDPQQRMLLEGAWEAMEDGGVRVDALAGQPVAVFVGISSSEYGALALQQIRDVEAYHSAGGALSVAANRISYAFDFRGPSMAVDTACSSSLVAVHLACQTLWSGESCAAIAGGANLLLSPAVSISFSRAGALSPDGRCKPFAAQADGIVRSEGVGVVFLKRLSDALRDGDRIYATILGGAVNQDGRTNGLAAPSGEAQRRVLEAAYAAAGVSAGEVHYIETHGAGTLLGDPIEAAALGAIVGRSRSADAACRIGSVKSNIGHLEAAAGVASLIKVALAIHNRELPATLHFRDPNPYIEFRNLGLHVQDVHAPWPVESAALAGVSAFGFGGTNVHVVMQEAPKTSSNRRADERSAGPPFVLPISARSDTALRTLAADWVKLLTDRDPDAAPLAAMCAAAGRRRMHHQHRLAVVASSAEAMCDRLHAFTNGESRVGLSAGVVPVRRRKTVFVFSGFGGQWWAMGRNIAAREPVFMETIQECDRLFRQYADWSVVEELGRSKAESRLDGRHLEITQLAVFALQMGMTSVWKSWGIQPDAVVGHSSGEIAAACVAGVLPLADGARICFHRARLLQATLDQATAEGVDSTMVAARFSPEAARERLDKRERLWVAGHNSPFSVVLTGDAELMSALLKELEAEGVSYSKLVAPGAGHSPALRRSAGELAGALQGLAPRPARIPIYSTVTGARADGADFDASYWARNVTQPVLFAEAIEGLREAGHEIFVELNAHPILSAAIAETFDFHGETAVSLPSLRQGEREATTPLRSLAVLYSHGHAVNWNQVFPGETAAVALPAYPWQRTRHWPERGLPTLLLGSTPDWERDHPLLGRHLEPAQPSGDHIWEAELDARAAAFLQDHVVGGRTAASGAVCLELALDAGRELLGAGCFTLRNVTFPQPLWLGKSQPRLLQTTFAKLSDCRARFEIWSRTATATATATAREHPWICHSVGELERVSNQPVPDASTTVTLPPEDASATIAGDVFYERMSSFGLEYGKSLRNVQQAWSRRGNVRVLIEPAAEVPVVCDEYVWHPALLDACFHALGAAALGERGQGLKALVGLPSSIECLRIADGPASRMWVVGKVQPSSESRDRVRADLHVTDEAGRLLIECTGYECRKLRDLRRLLDDDPSRWLYDVRWRARPREDAHRREPGAEQWLIFEDASGVGQAAAALLASEGVDVVRIWRGDTDGALAENRFRIRPGRADSLAWALDQAWRGDVPFTTILYLWALDVSIDDETPIETVDGAQDIGCVTALLLVKDLSRRGGDRPPRIWFVTRGAQPIGDATHLAVAQAPLWGFGRSLSLEWPTYWGGLIDVDPSAAPRDVARTLYEEILSGERDDQIAYRDEQRHVARLVQTHANGDRSAATLWRPDAAYLLTGAFGRIGPSIAHWMVSQGAQRLILVGRTPFPPRCEWDRLPEDHPSARRVRTVRDLESRGATVVLGAVDVGDENALGAFLGRCREQLPGIRGVIHAAGLFELRTIDEITPEVMVAVLRSKVRGGWLLHQLLRDLPLDFFVMFSSLSSMLTLPFVTHYAAANAFLDALAHYRRSRGLAALTINWGLWGEAGMRAHTMLPALDTFSPDEAFGLLDDLLRTTAVQTGVARVDWTRHDLDPRIPHIPLLAELTRPVRQAESAPVASVPRSAVRQSILAAPPSDRLPLLTRLITSEIEASLGLSPDALDPEAALNRMGLDSLTAIELKQKFERKLGITVPTTAFAYAPTASELARYILERWDADLAQAGVS